MVAHRRVAEAGPAAFADPERAIPHELRVALKGAGIERLYRHQAEALDACRAGRDVLSVTPTASGKTLTFALPVIEALLDDPDARALFLYPTKALARDQVAALAELAREARPLRPPTFEIYDGDTPQGRRRAIKRDPPSALVTNPDMLHVGILAHHADWARFLRGVRFIVLDELHVYRGVFGAHVHHILARLTRACRRYGTSPRFIAASATVGNPDAFAGRLAGRSFHVVRGSGAPVARRDVLFVNPVTVSPYTVALRALAATVEAGARTIAFTKARRVTELLHAWLARAEPELARRVAPYRAGYLPEERRAIEARLFGGDLRAVISTSALELGIDVGDLDACLLVGYPGSRVATWQRIGRVGRRGKDAVVVLVAMPDSLDQYVVRHPDVLFDGRFEPAVLDPTNVTIAGRHLECSAAEEPLTTSEIEDVGGGEAGLLEALSRHGRLVRDDDGDRWHCLKRRPHRDVHPRSSGAPWTIFVAGSGAVLGSVDSGRVDLECHEGAVYLHGGRSYRIESMDRDHRKVVARRADLDYYTAVMGDKETEVLEVFESSSTRGGIPVRRGRVRVTMRVRGYQKKRLFDGETFAEVPLEAPPRVFETIALWLEVPRAWAADFSGEGLHFMGGLHAAEHAAIGLLPLLAISDRGDVGGISYTRHPQLGRPAVFLYDGIPGGVGLADRAFREIDDLLTRTRDHVRNCPCEDGCPACIQSPTCGNGNKPLDKEACLRALDACCGDLALPVDPPDADVADGAVSVADRSSAGDRPSLARRKHGISRAPLPEPIVPGSIRAVEGVEAPPGAAAIGTVETPVVTVATSAGPPASRRPPNAPIAAPIVAPRDVVAPDGSVYPKLPHGDRAPRTAPAAVGEFAERVVVFDLETRRAASEVGGWGRIERMGLALAVVYDVSLDRYTTYREPDVDRLLLDLVMADRVVGFNVDGFDLRVLAPYTPWDLARIRTFDLLSDLRRRLGFRVSLANLAQWNLGESKSADGLASLAWWREGRDDLVEAYCRRDVEVTWKLFARGREDGYVLYRDDDRTYRVPVVW